MSNDRPTDPAPEGDLEAEIHELLGAVRNVGDLATRLETALLRVQLAVRTLEHKVNVDRENRINDRRWLADLERRVRVLEDTAAE